MKKVLYFAALILCVGLSSCEKEEIENTATVNTAGEWYVMVDAAGEDGNLIEGFEDLFGIGRINLMTYNTSANDPNVMFVDDLSNFWNFKVRVSVDQNARTFQGEAANERGDDITVNISGGKILEKAGRQNNGSPADSIVFYVSFSDDTYPATYGYKNYRVSGVRYSGLKEND